MFALKYTNLEQLMYQRRTMIKPLVGLHVLKRWFLIMQFRPVYL